MKKEERMISSVKAVDSLKYETLRFEDMQVGQAYLDSDGDLCIKTDTDSRLYIRPSKEVYHDACMSENYEKYGPFILVDVKIEYTKVVQ